MLAWLREDLWRSYVQRGIQFREEPETWENSNIPLIPMIWYHVHFEKELVELTLYLHCYIINYVVSVIEIFHNSLLLSCFAQFHR